MGVRRDPLRSGLSLSLSLSGLEGLGFEGRGRRSRARLSAASPCVCVRVCVCVCMFGYAWLGVQAMVALGLCYRVSCSHLRASTHTWRNTHTLAW